jgi:hypothetical protein
LPAKTLREIWNSLGLETLPVTTHASIVDALEAVRYPRHTLIAGSLYHAGEALAFIENKSASFERSAQ